MALAYLCLQCGCIHGWGEHPLIVKVTRHIRSPGEDIWYCPSCGRENRTFDGGLFGQMEKKWQQIDLDDPSIWPIETREGTLFKNEQGEIWYESRGDYERFGARIQRRIGKAG